MLLEQVRRPPVLVAQPLLVGRQPVLQKVLVVQNGRPRPVGERAGPGKVRDRPQALQHQTIVRDKCAQPEAVRAEVLAHAVHDVDMARVDDAHRVDAQHAPELRCVRSVGVIVGRQRVDLVADQVNAMSVAAADGTVSDADYFFLPFFSVFFFGGARGQLTSS